MDETRSHSSASRGSALAAALVAALVLYCCVFLGLHFLPLADDARAGWTANLFLIPSLLAAVMSGRTYRMSTGRERRLWLIITFALSALALSEIARLTISTTLPLADISPADAFHLLGYISFIPAVLIIGQRAETTGLGRVRGLLDFVTLVLMTLVAAYATLLRPLGALETTASTATAIKLAFYPVAALALALYLFAFKRGGYRRWEAFVVIAFSAFAVGDIGYDLFLLLDLWAPGEFLTGVMSLAHVVGFGTFAVAAELARVASADEDEVARAAAGSATLPVALATILSLVGIPALLVLGARSASSVDRTVFTYAGIALTWIVVTRNVVISDENQRLIQRAITDPLTGLFSHSHLHERLKHEMRRAARSGESLSLCLIDVDDFSSLNRRYGFAAGDHRLRVIAQRLKARTRVNDTCFRVGGDDFAIIMPTTDSFSAFAACTRVIEELSGPDEYVDLSLTCSVGIAEFPLHADTVDDLVHLAEGAAYWAKTHGGGDILIYDPEVVELLDEKEHIRHLEKRSHSSMVEVLAAAVDARDPYTRFHSANVSVYAEALAGAMGLDGEHVELIRSAALLHDVGKIGVADQVLRKPDRLTDEEYLQVKEHPSLGVSILQASTRTDLLPWVRGHHERWDGGGYPDRLAGEDIPLEARLIGICDSFDAMTTNRPYRPAMDTAEAISELRAHAGVQFDPEIVERFVELLESGVVAPSPAQ